MARDAAILANDLCTALGLDPDRIKMLEIVVTPHGATVHYVEHLTKPLPSGVDVVLKRCKLVEEDELKATTSASNPNIPKARIDHA